METDLKKGNIYLARRRQFKYLLMILGSLVVADGLISQFLVKYRLGYEANPFLQTFVSETDFLLIKIAGVMLCTLILWDVFKNHPKAAFATTVASIALYTGILYWNIGLYIFS